MFYADKNHSNELHRFTGTSEFDMNVHSDGVLRHFQPFVVHSDRVFYKFMAKPNSERRWGFRFYARCVQAAV